MSDNSKIEWTDATWNVVLGCDRVSPGCDSCYAIRTARRMSANPNPKVSTAYAGLVEQRDDRLDWTGQVNLVPDRLDLPLRWTKPRRIFVNAQSDLFHDQVSDEFIARVWAVMAATPQHTYQVLTKRHGRMRAFLQDRCRCTSGHGDGVHLKSKIEWASTPHNPDCVPGLEPGIYHRMTWPLPNVWLGVSVEDQKRADLRIPALLDTPAAVRFLSCEPLLGPVDLDPWMWDPVWSSDPESSKRAPRSISPSRAGVDWVIVGGESGPGARPMHPDWARDLRDQCTAAGVAFHFKQWGGATSKAGGRELDERTWDEMPTAVTS